MIFVTVGTHEQQFDRVVKEIDLLKEKEIIKEEVFIQTGYCDYKPKHCKYKDVISYKEMDKYTKEASIVITHGGPGSIFQAIQYGKKPVVVPRNPDFDEHVDDHQIKFAKRMKENNRIDLVLDIKTLSEAVLEYKGYENIKYTNESSNFIQKFDSLINNMFSGGINE